VLGHNGRVFNYYKIKGEKYMAEFFTYPLREMKITQNYKGTTSHLPHTMGSPKDYPIDEGGKNTGKDPIYARCDLIVKRLYTAGTNTIWVRTVDKVILANGKTDYVVMMLIHSDNEDFAKLKVGQIIKKGSILCYEGSDGATANHIHIAVGLGDLKGNGWVQNSKGKWVLSTTGGTIKPEKCFYIDREFTNVRSMGGIAFKDMPKYTTGTYRATANVNVRKGAGTNYKAKTFKQLSKNAQNKILKLTGGEEANGYVKGLTFTVSKIKNNWGKTPSGWVCLDYAEKIK
jgi:hypothetical protein